MQSDLTVGVSLAMGRFPRLNTLQRVPRFVAYISACEIMMVCLELFTLAKGLGFDNSASYQWKRRHTEGWAGRTSPVLRTGCQG